jgi:hypothetical protein
MYWQNQLSIHPTFSETITHFVTSSTNASIDFQVAEIRSFSYWDIASIQDHLKLGRAAFKVFIQNSAP